MRKVMMTMMVLLLAVTIATAQRGDQRGHRGNDFLAELKLTPEQQAQIKAIKQEGRAQMKEMRQQTTEQRPDRDAMKKMREASEAKVNAVLTTEQREQLAAIKAERKAAWKAVDRKGMKAALKEHNETKVKPVIAAARAQFEQFISAEDKLALERLRPVFANKPKHAPGRGQGKVEGEKPSDADRAATKAAMETWRTEHATELAEIKALTQKYSADLKRIQERMKPQREQWGKEKREIMSTYLPEGANKAEGRRGAPRSGKGGKGKAKLKGKGKGKQQQKAGKDWPRGAAFLLMKS